jgi:hypothetical protein
LIASEQYFFVLGLKFESWKVVDEDRSLTMILQLSIDSVHEATAWFKLSSCSFLPLGPIFTIIMRDFKLFPEPSGGQACSFNPHAGIF